MGRGRIRVAPKEERTVRGIVFHSKREAKRYEELCLMERGGLIADLELQPEFPIVVNGTKVCVYRADFRYIDTSDGSEVVEDAKGYRTEIYKLKRKLVEATWGIDIQEV